jgi:sugar transferase (PEP-CTERM system associated)
MLGDLLILTTGLIGGNCFFTPYCRTLSAEPLPFLAQMLSLVFLGILTFHVGGVYDDSRRPGRKEIAVRVMTAAAVWGTLLAALAFSLPSLSLGRLSLFFGILIGTLGVIGLRWMASLVPTTNGLRERLLFLGATPVADRLISELETNNPGYEILGFVDDQPAHEVALSNGFRVLGTTQQLQEVVSTTRTDTIVVALTERRRTFPIQAIMDCKLRGVHIEDWPAFYEKLTGKILVQNLRPSWLVFSEGFSRTRITRFVKRVVDLLLSLLFLGLGWPIFLLVALAIKLSSRGPVLFRQERVGEHGRLFSLLKFRTMVDDAEASTGPVWTSAEDPRITRIGRVLRKTRLDEFPQLINVLKGEMSFIGPRPERPHFVESLQEKIPYYAQRHTIKPGITGWAQVRYRYGATIEDAEEKLQYDLYYVKNMSMFLDMLILLYSIQVVLFGKGAR